MKNYVIRLSAILCIASIFFVSYQSNHSTVVAEEVSNKKLNNSEEFNIKKRALYGLKADKDTVKNLIEKYDGKNVIFEEFYLTNDEKKELDTRFLHQDTFVPKVKAKINELLTEDNFGGLFVRQEEGGVLYVGVKNLNKNSDEILNKINNEFQDNNKVEFVNVKYSEKELTKIIESIQDKWSDYTANGIELQYTSLDTINNRIEIGLVNNTADNKRVFTDEFGEVFNFYTANPSSHKEEGDTSTLVKPLQGGTNLHNYTGGNYCSLGFSAKSNTTSDYYIVTAGHCYGSGSSNTFYHPLQSNSNSIIMGAPSSTVKNSGNVDALLLGSTSTLVSNKVYFEYVGAKALTSYATGSSEYVGQHVCIASRQNDTCGTIKSTNLNYDDQTDITAADYTAIPGDSGGTIFGNGVLHGIHEGDQELSGVTVEGYTQVQNILTYFNISPKLN